MLLQAERIASQEVINQIQGYIDNMYPSSFSIPSKKDIVTLAKGDVVYIEGSYPMGMVWDFSRNLLTDASGFYYE